MVNCLPISYEGDFPSSSLALHVHLKSWKIENAGLLFKRTN